MNTTMRLWLLGVLCGIAITLHSCTPGRGWNQYMDAGEQAFQQGHYAEAEPLLVAALEEAEKFGPQDPRLVTSLNNLAGLYYAQGKYDQAEPLLKRALAINEQTLGAEPLEVATSLQNLALLYDAQGKYAEAEPLYQRALAIKEQVLGPEHPSVVKSLENYAALLRKTGRDAEATTLEARLQIVQSAPTSETPTARPEISTRKGVKTTEITLSYEEPTTSSDDLPLTTLAKTTIYYDMGNGPVKAMEVPATSATGGGVIRQTLSIPVSDDQETQVTLWVTATDVQGKESTRSEEKMIKIQE